MFSRKGFISVVAWKGRPGCFLVRGRYRGHLEALFPSCKVEETGKNQVRDYRFRTVVNREELCKVIIRRVVDDLDYPNFKASVPAGRYKSRLENIWRGMRGDQDIEEMLDRSTISGRKGEGHGKGKKVR